MRILVTGGAGFIGSHLVEALLARGHRVIVLDDFSTGRRVNLSEHCDALELIEGSVCDGQLVERICGRVDQVYHLAASVGVQLVREQPLHALDTNTLGVQVVLAAAAPRRVPVVIASSSEVYGASVAVPFREQDGVQFGHPRELRSSYACAKAWAECAAFAHAAEFDLPVLVVRLFNTVGPRQRARYGMVLPRFVEQALAGKPLTVFGDGLQTRCFAHVEDVVQSMIGVVERERFGEVFNLGADEECSILDLARRVLAATGGTSSIERMPFEAAHPGFGAGVRRRVPDLSSLRRALGAVPMRDLDVIVDDTIAERRALTS